jgi:hypothetical protein
MLLETLQKAPIIDVFGHVTAVNARDTVFPIVPLVCRSERRVISVVVSTKTQQERNIG